MDLIAPAHGRKIDYDRGVEFRRTPSGITVYMYLDSPGVFLNAHGGEVSKELAREAGFDIVRLIRERERRTALDAALAEVNKQFSYVGPETVVKERDGYTLINLGNGRFVVRYPDGANAGTPMDAVMAEALFNNLVPAKAKTKTD